MTEETAQRIADALERIADAFEREGGGPPNRRAAPARGADVARGDGPSRSVLCAIRARAAAGTRTSKETGLMKKYKHVGTLPLVVAGRDKDGFQIDQQPSARRSRRRCSP
jgi:hypothetical protein